MENEVSTEVWRPVAGYEGLYEVSNWGHVRSLERTVPAGRHTRTVPQKMLRLRTIKRGYKQATLFRDNNRKEKLVHRLVATAFCEKPAGCDEVNHLDNNPANNRADNLEWTTPKENTRYSINQGRRKFKSVYSSGGRYYPIMRMAEADGFSAPEICRVCKGKRKTHKGEAWWYADQGMGDGIHGEAQARY